MESNRTNEWERRVRVGDGGRATERERDERGRVASRRCRRRESLSGVVRKRKRRRKSNPGLACGINSFIFISARNRSERAAVVVGNERTPSASLARGFVFVVARRWGYSLSRARAEVGTETVKGVGKSTES